MSLSNIKVNNSSIIGIDAAPILMSDNLVKSEGVYKAVENRTMIPLDSLFLFKPGHINSSGSFVDSGEYIIIPVIDGDYFTIKNNIN